MHNEPLLQTPTPIIPLQLNEVEIPTMPPRAILFVRESADPDGTPAVMGAAGCRSSREIALVLTGGRGILCDEEVAEERFEERGTAADETCVDIDDAVSGDGGKYTCD